MPAAPKHTKISADDPSLLPSDEEDDDFVLDDDESASDSDSEDEAAPAKKKSKVEGPEQPNLTKQDVDDLWASFNAEPDPYAAPSTTTVASTTAPTAATSTSTSASADPKASTSTTSSTPTARAAADDKSKKKMIIIQVEYKFVGETVMQEKEVPIDSPEAQAWLAKQEAAATTSSSSSSAPADSSSDSKVDALFGPESNSTDGHDPLNATPSASESPAPMASDLQATRVAVPAPAPGPRRAKAGGLGALAASLSKPAKLNTLEKSKLDWNSYVTKEDGLSDSLTHARKDGYLEKQDFLSRTESAREDAWEKGKSTRRR